MLTSNHPLVCSILYLWFLFSLTYSLFTLRSLWDYCSNTRLAYLPNSSNKGLKASIRITALDLINPHDTSLLVVGTDDGSIRVWNHQSALHGVASSTGGVSLVTAWQALAEAPQTAKSVNGKWS